jgi:hypothetical protein
VTDHPKAKFEVIPYQDSSDVQDATHVFHGETSLPNGYKWSILNSICLDNMLSHNSTRSEIRVGRSQSWLKMLTSITQLVLSSITLYHTRGPQVDRYGYAAFGLSVFPYALMSLVNLFVLGIIGEYACLFVLRTAISEEAKKCGGRISGELGTPLDVSGHGVDVTLPEVRDDGETDLLLGAGDDDRTRLSMEASGGEVKMIGTSPEAGTNEPNDELGTSLVTSEEGKVGTWLEDMARHLIGLGEEARPVRRVSSMRMQLSSGQKEFTAAWLRTEDTEHGKILVIRTSSTTKRFKLVDRNDCDDDALTFYVDSITNQRKAEHKYPDSDPDDFLSFIYPIMSLVVFILPYVFIFLLTGFHKRRSTAAQRGWMMTWLVVNQGVSTYGIFGGRTELTIFGGAVSKIKTVGIVCVGLYVLLVLSIPAIGGFVMVGKMLIEFGSCSLTP